MIGPNTILFVDDGLIEKPDGIPKELEDLEGEIHYSSEVDWWGGYLEFIPLAAHLRLVIPARAPFVYWSVETAIGGTLGHYSDGFTALFRTGPAFMLGPWFEIRLDLGGVQMFTFEWTSRFQYSTSSGYEIITRSARIVGLFYSPSISLVLRI